MKVDDWYEHNERCKKQIQEFFNKTKEEVIYNGDVISLFFTLDKLKRI